MIDTNAVLKFLARSTPKLIGALPEAGVSSYPQLMAVALWLLTAAVAGMPDLSGDIDELGTSLLTAYDTSLVVFKKANPGVVEAADEAGSIVVLVPPVLPNEASTVN